MKKEKTAPSRRDFLKLAGTGAPAAAAALAISGTDAEAEEVEAGSGLRKTEHVKKYLETARF
ncbi:twin-arginine translocation signal domain-containing protein [Pseudohalocynthiibacter sp. F2068]|jgi:hypothetical protein|uniref:twin-arginine translocation signal domain-containing protein n=1 Tax=Pseudohalocynthiibacter sp. F2068 TaxID=2926418 RepID=UPI001FF226C8|nr:twin-arginine translocation signal domain-containing protein [Pseudohalocynthiibacter sp. F2068]MCK0104273.1 twin-arginine translocation signal domain-containing protein [Pseudohalocynthiibacter sp. F2068]